MEFVEELLEGEEEDTSPGQEVVVTGGTVTVSAECWKTERTVYYSGEADADANRKSSIFLITVEHGRRTSGSWVRHKRYSRRGYRSIQTSEEASAACKPVPPLAPVSNERESIVGGVYQDAVLAG